MVVKCIYRSYFGPVLLYMAVAIASVQALWSQFDMVAVENSETGIAITNLKVTRFNRSTFTVSGTINATADLNDDYDAEFKVFYSSQGNSKYILMPYKVPRDGCCAHLESTYWKALEKSLHESSDIPPRNGDEKYCFAWKKGVYTIQQFLFNYKVIPKFAETGTYKFVFFVYKKGSSDISSTATFMGRLY